MSSKHEIIQYNREFLYHIPKREYPNIYTCFKKYPRLKELLYYIYREVDEKQTLPYKHMTSFIITNKKLRSIMHAYNDRQVNPQVNYLFALGVIRKLNDKLEGMSYIMEEWKKDNPKKETMNTLILVKLTDEKLDQIEQRAKLLLERRISPSNISAKNLIVNGLEWLADELYFRNRNARKNIEANQEIAFREQLIECMQEEIQRTGYTTKEDVVNWIKEGTGWSNIYINRYLGRHRAYINDVFHYHKPTQQEKALYKLKSSSFIYTSLE